MMVFALTMFNIGPNKFLSFLAYKSSTPKRQQNICILIIIAICIQACGVRFQNVRFTFQNVRLPFQNVRLPFQNVRFCHVTCHVWAMKLTCFRA